MCELGEYVRVKLKGHSQKRRIDKCMAEEILKLNKDPFKTIACCCGHGIYPKTIVIRDSRFNIIFELLSGIKLEKRKSYYKLDKKTGCYIIPEVSGTWKDLPEGIVDINGDMSLMCPHCKTLKLNTDLDYFKNDEGLIDVACKPCLKKLGIKLKRD